MRRLLGGLLVGWCFFAAFHTTTAYAQESYIGATPDNPETAWAVTDCHTPWNSSAANAVTLRADCNLRFNGPVVRYAYPKIEWRTFGARTVTAVFADWKNQYTSTVNALGELRTTVGAKKKWTPKIVYSGDVSALGIFSDVMAVSTTAPATIGGIVVNAQNKQQVQVHTRRINRIGKAPILMALYDQYDGHLYLHAFKSRRTSGKHVEILHTRLSPLHLGFLRGSTHADNPFRKFYTAADAYLFDGVDFAGAITAAGRMARHLRADLVVFYVPTIDIALIRRRINNAIIDKTESTDIYTQVYPKWFYGIPQATNGISGVNIGFTGAICGVSAPSIDADDCEEDDFFPSYLTMMKVSEFSVDDDEKKLLEFLINNEGATLPIENSRSEFYSVPVGDIIEADGGRMLTEGSQSDFFQVLISSMHSNNILAEDFSGKKDFFIGASYVAEEKSAFIKKIQLADAVLSNGSLSSAHSYSNQGLAALNAISQDLVGKIGTNTVDGDGGLESIRRLYRGDDGSGDDCTTSSSREDCVGAVDDLGILVDDLGIVPRPDDFIPHAGGDLVVPYLSTQEGIDALQEARK